MVDILVTMVSNSNVLKVSRGSMNMFIWSCSKHVGLPDQNADLDGKILYDAEILGSSASDCPIVPI